MRSSIAHCNWCNRNGGAVGASLLGIKNGPLVANALGLIPPDFLSFPLLPSGVPDGRGQRDSALTSGLGLPFKEDLHLLQNNMIE